MTDHEVEEAGEDLQTERSVFRAEYERELGHWLRRRLGLLCLVYAAYEALTIPIFIVASVVGGDATVPAAVVASGPDEIEVSIAEPPDPWTEEAREAEEAAARATVETGGAKGGASSVAPFVAPVEAFMQILEWRLEHAAEAAEAGGDSAADGDDTYPWTRDGRQWSTRSMAPWIAATDGGAARLRTVGPEDAPRSIGAPAVEEAPPGSAPSNGATSATAASRTPARTGTPPPLPWWIFALVAAPTFGVLAWFGLIIRRRLETRGALVVAASRMILALGFLNFAFEVAVLLANPEAPVFPLVSIVVWHLTASLFLPWSWSESLRPIAPLLAAWLLLRLGVAVGDGDWGSLLTTIILLPVLFAPALVLCVIRLRRHRDRFKTGFVGRRFVAMRREFIHARAIHESLFPKPVSEDWLRFDFSYRPAADIGGDFVHAWFDDEERFHLAILDVTGHGLASAMSVARIHGEIERLRDEHPEEGPARILARLNRYFHRLLARHSLYATGILLTIDPRTGELRYASAGHPPIFLRRGSEVRELESTTFMLGAVDAELFGEEESLVQLEERDTLILFTDGAYDARSPRGERFGLDRLREVMRRPNPPVRWSQYLMRLVETFEAGLPEDDLLVAEVTFTQRRSVWRGVTGDAPPQPAPARAKDADKPTTTPGAPTPRPSPVPVEPTGAGAVA